MSPMPSNPLWANMNGKQAIHFNSIPEIFLSLSLPRSLLVLTSLIGHKFYLIPKNFLLPFSFYDSSCQSVLLPGKLGGWAVIVVIFE